MQLASTYNAMKTPVCQPCSLELDSVFRQEENFVVLMPGDQFQESHHAQGKTTNAYP
jgi:hypothetical protein